jgi:CheY-like chemotaxis protein
LDNDVVSFSNGKLAIEYLDANHIVGDRNIIFLDLNMPIMGGWEFLDAVDKRPYSSTLSVIIVTSSFDRNEREMAKAHKSIVMFIEKPIGAESIDNIRKIMS